MGRGDDEWLNGPVRGDKSGPMRQNRNDRLLPEA